MCSVVLRDGISWISETCISFIKRNPGYSSHGRFLGGYGHSASKPSTDPCEKFDWFKCASKKEGSAEYNLRGCWRNIGVVTCLPPRIIVHGVPVDKKAKDIA
jgi:hypothetical protein